MDHAMQTLPKLELHLHIEGAAQPEFIRRLAGEKQTDLSGIFAEDGSYKYSDFWDFLRVYEVATSVLTRPEDFARLTASVLEESASHGVIYTEAFISPDFCGGRDVGAWKEYLAAIREAAEEAERRHGITMRGIVTPIRHFGPEKGRETAICAAETAGDFITGFGIGGDEKAGTLQDFGWAFDCAREAGLGLTAHAGEWGGPDSVRQAVQLGVQRIGHGVRAIEDVKLVNELAEAGTTLEVCPGSNIVLGVYDRWDDHPVEKLRAEGVNITVSTDDPPFFHTTMTQEYEKLSQHFGWEQEHFAEISRNAVAAAFCDDATRKKLTERLQTAGLS